MNPEHSGPLRPLYLFLEEKMKKLCKKVLTSAGKHDIITKLSDADGAPAKRALKKPKKGVDKAPELW